MSWFLLVCALVAGEIDQLGWLAGHWKGKLGKAVSEEVWMEPAGGAMVGMSRIVAGERMAMFEYMRVEQRPDGVYFVAQPLGRPATSFKLTKREGQKVVFENPEHDHPKVITYELAGPGKLDAAIEGEVKGKLVRQEFRFERVER